MRRESFGLKTKREHLRVPLKDSGVSETGWDLSSQVTGGGLQLGSGAGCWGLSVRRQLQGGYTLP